MIGQHRLDALAYFGVEAVAWHVGQHGEEAAIAILAHEQTRARAFAQVQHRHCDVEQFVGRALEHLVTRQRVENVAQGLARMRIPLEAGALQDGLVVVAQQRHFARRRHVGRRGQHAEEALLDHRLALCVEAEHREVIHVAGTMHARARIGLGQDQCAHRAGFVEIGGGEGLERTHRHAGATAAHDAEAGVAYRLEHFIARLFGNAILAIAEKGEVVIGNPVQEVLRFLECGLVERQVLGWQRLGNGLHLRLHLRPIRHRRAHIIQRQRDVLAQVLDFLGTADMIDVEQHDRLGSALPALLVAEIEDVTARIARHGENRMDHGMRGKTRLVDGHRHRIDQERHVVGGYCDQGVPAFESFAVLVRVEHADLCRLCLALTCEFEHELGNARPFGRITGGDVIGRHMAEEMRCKCLRLALSAGSCLGRNLAQDGFQAFRFGGGTLSVHFVLFGLLSVGAEDTPRPTLNPPEQDFPDSLR